MTEQEVAADSGWGGFRHLKGDALGDEVTIALIGILDTVDVPIVVVDADFTIRCFNRAAGEVLCLAQSDIGRSPCDTAAFRGLQDVKEWCAQVIASGAPRRHDFLYGLKSFVVRVAPYAKSDHDIGTVLTFTNVTGFRASIDQAIYEREYTKAILNTVGDPLVVLSADLCVQTGNRAFYEMFGVSRDQTHGIPLQELEKRAFKLAKVQSQLEEMLAEGKAFQPFEIDHEFPAFGPRTVLVNARQFSLPRQSGTMILLVFHDVTARKEAEAASSYVASIVEYSDDAIVSKSLSGVIKTWNKGAERLFGYAAEEVIGKPIAILVPPDRPNDEPEILERIRRGEHVDPYETVRRRKDGSLVDISLSVSPVRDATGAVVGASKIARDISLRKHAEQTRQLLLGELNHRVKNTLASVQAIARQTLSSTTDPLDFATRFSGRIESLAGAHSLLTEATWQGADLRKLIEDQLSQWAADEIKFTARGPAVLLTPQVTLHLALMLHELGTNSAKYGALSAAAGRVKLSWTVDAGMLHLQWVERGGPAVSAPTRRGFGTLLIAQSAKGEGGDAQMICEAEGVSWKIMLPLSSSTASNDPSSLPTSERIGGAAKRQDAQQRADSGLPLAGRHFLVIEDEPLIALDLAGSLEAAGAKVAPPVGKETEALQVIERTDFDGALLDGNLHGRPVDAIAAALTRRNIPFVFITGYGREGLPSAFGHIAVLTKPFGREQLLEAVNEAVRRDNNALQPKP